MDFDQKPLGVSRLWTAAMVIILWVLMSIWVSGETPGSTTRLKVAEPPVRSSARMAPWPPLRISTPEAEGIDPVLLEEAYQRAAEIPRIYSVLVVRHGALAAERYFSEPDRLTAMPVASVGKSIVGALAGIAIDQGLVGLEDRMIAFFPEHDVASLDPRKRDITVRDLVMMRAGYPFDSTNEYFDRLARSRDWMRFIIRVWELERDPGTGWAYSSASAHLLGGVLTRATGMSLQEFANRYLFGRMGLPVEVWPRDPQGFCAAHGDVYLTPLQMASFGQMVLDMGVWRGRRILPWTWVWHTKVPHSHSQYGSQIFPYRDIRYGYLWWIAEIRGHDVVFAWGHGGQFITLVPDLDLVVVTTADNFVGDFTDSSWNTEGAIMRLIGTHVIPAVE